MEVREFDEFVSRQQVGLAGEDQVNWYQERDEWLKHLDALYTRIETLLSQYTSSGRISIRYVPIDLNEEDIGSYAARQMILRIGRQEVDLVPIGTRFIGYKGRVDAIGSAGKASLVLAKKDWHSTIPQATFRIRPRGLTPVEPLAGTDKIEWIWKIMPRPPERQLSELTDESLFQLIMEVTNG